jgi:hypothetical protein
MRAIAAALVVFLVGCQSTGYQEYALAMSRIAESQASVAREQAQAMILLARDPQASETTRTVAVLMLALGVQNSKAQVQMQPPINETLEWVRVLAGPVSNIGLAYFGYRLGVHTSSDNAANVQASYAALAAFKPAPAGPQLPTTVNNTWTRSDTVITNKDGFVVSGGAAQQAPTTANQDNSPVAIIPPVVIVPTEVVAPVVVPGFGP